MNLLFDFNLKICTVFAAATYLFKNRTRNDGLQTTGIFAQLKFIKRAILKNFQTEIFMSHIKTLGNFNLLFCEDLTDHAFELNQILSKSRKFLQKLTHVKYTGIKSDALP